uniref:Large ribosomal subunit protein uL16m n=2 Tax=Timema TaxID=61471 RepID=A0A7R9FYX7_TIMSH|nr:unnamed protein product [Timema shepardi]
MTGPSYWCSSHTTLGAVYIFNFKFSSCVSCVQATGGGRMRYGHFEMVRLGIGRKLDVNRMFALWRIDAPWQPVTKKGQGQRMGGGKGAIDHYVTPIKAGRVIVEIGGNCEFSESTLVSFFPTCTCTPPTISTAWTAPQSMFSKLSMTSSPLYSAPMRTPLSIGSPGGHYRSCFPTASGSSLFSHWTRPGGSGGYLTRWFLGQRPVRPMLEMVAHKLPFKAEVVSQEIMEMKAEKELREERDNLNPYTFKYVVQNNMGGCQNWISPYDRKWFGKHQ